MDRHLNKLYDDREDLFEALKKMVELFDDDFAEYSAKEQALTTAKQALKTAS